MDDGEITAMSKARKLTEGINWQAGKENLSSIRYQLSSKNGFTIVELMVVIAIIAILAGAITMGVSGMFYKSRMGKAIALQKILQGGMETYYTQRGKWPGDLDSISQNPMTDSGKDYVTLKPGQVDSCFQEIVKESWGKNSAPVLDPSGLYVIDRGKLRNDYGCTDIHKSWNKALKSKVVDASDHKCDGKCPRGRDFTEATKKGAPNRISNTGSMIFGYAGPNNGRFCRFTMRYYPKSDTVQVHLQKATEYYDSKRDRYGYFDD